MSLAAHNSEFRRWRAGILSLARGQRFAGLALGLTQVAAAQALGMTYAQTMGYIVLPQAFRNMTPVLLLDGVGLCFETEISRCALDSCMAQERSNCLQIASTFQNVESLRPA